MQDRPTRTFQTSEGRTLVLREYITGAENWQIRQIYIQGMKGGTDNESALQAERKAFELVVVSVDGATENIADAIMNLPLAEYQEVANEVTPIIEGKKK